MRYFLSVLLLYFFTLVSAQVEGVKLYVTGNYFWLESKVQESLSDLDTEIKFENGDYGFDIGYGLIYDLNSRIVFGTDLNYSDRNRNQFDPFGTKQTVKYIGLHQKIFFSINNLFKPYAGVGFNHLMIKRSSADIDFDSTRSFYSNLDIAVHAGFAFRVSMIELFVDFQFGISPQRKINLTDLGTEVEVNSKSRLLRAGVAYIIEGKKEEKKK